MKKLLLLATTCSILLTGCISFALLARNTPSQQAIRLLATAPENYSIRVDSGTSSEQAVGRDGRVTVNVPSLPRGCDVYFFNIKVGGAERPLDQKVIQVVRGVDIVKKLSLNDLTKLPIDSEGYRLLRINK